MSKKVLYASCGSNLRTERFMAYIKGGTIKGASREYQGCRDKTPPTRKLVLASHAHHVYFARESTVWGEEPYNQEGSGIFGGLGVMGIKTLSDDVIFDGLRSVEVETELLADIISNNEMVVAGYPITLQQFSDVMSQENDYQVGTIDLPAEFIDTLSYDNQLVDLKNRLGENAIILPSGEKFEINVDDDYSALCYLGELEIDGEMLTALCFTSPYSFEAALDEEDDTHYLNPASLKYIQMIASGIVELGQGNNDWTTENAYEYLLSLAPFSIDKFKKETELIRKSLFV